MKMEVVAHPRITVETIVNVPVEKAWELWTTPWHIMHWNFASIDWHTTYAENDFRVGGKFLYRMEPVNGRQGFDFSGEFTSIELYKVIDYVIADGRKVKVTFEVKGFRTRIAEIFEAETKNRRDLQQEGWQAILDNFKRYAESYKDDMIHFEAIINCPPGAVYRAITEDEPYREWSSVFNPSSYFKGSWKKGSGIRFLGVDDEGRKSGMISRIKENIPDRFISIEHMGMILKDIDYMCGPEVDEWQGALENYTLVPRGNRTIIYVDLDNIGPATEELKGMWPKALDKLRQVSERLCR
ncbi:MAG TPA: SRPBCC family protein [Bacteroidales bacterium]|nr:SRPBCC family protein [Bacteroidales bacterium]